MLIYRMKVEQMMMVELQVYGILLLEDILVIVIDILVS